MNKRTINAYFKSRLKFPAAALVFSCTSISPVIFAQDTIANPVSDLRVIIDISGSMKKTDPNNLRRPALRLLAGMIPQGSRAGVWNFGQQVNMTVGIGEVDDAWREQARKQSQKISSVGLYTNIEAAMRKATFDWKNPDPHFKRNLILLTDGHVDISKDAKQNTVSRSKILKEILPQLEKANVHIHTLALSDNVDESLLSTLSAYTNGLYKKITSADDLQKLFLQMLEQSVNLDTLPLKDNVFNVDASIKDMTLLVFNKDNSTPTKIITPGKQTWTEKNNAAEVKWFGDESFDLVTIKKPQQGKWRIIAPEDENNRVVIATNLKLILNDLPGYAMIGDTINVNARLFEDDKVLTDERLLSKFIFSIERKIEGQGEWHYEMSVPEKNDSKSYYLMPSISRVGTNELVIRAVSPTAEREVRHHFKVYATPAEIKINKNKDQYQIVVKPYENLLRPDSINIAVKLNDASVHKLVRKGEVWVTEISEKYHDTMFDIDINATRADGSPITMSFHKALSSLAGAESLKLEANKPAVKKEEKEVHIAKEEHAAEKKQVEKAEHKKTEEKNKNKPVKENSDINWTLIIISIAAGNILLFGTIAVGYIVIKRRKEKMRASLNEEIAE